MLSLVANKCHKTQGRVSLNDNKGARSFQKSTWYLRGRILCPHVHFAGGSRGEPHSPGRYKLGRLLGREGWGAVNLNGSMGDGGGESKLRTATMPQMQTVFASGVICMKRMVSPR